MGWENVISLCVWCNFNKPSMGQLPRADGKETGYSKRHSSIAKIDVYFCCCRLKILKSSSSSSSLLSSSSDLQKFSMPLASTIVWPTSVPKTKLQYTQCEKTCYLCYISEHIQLSQIGLVPVD